jgi:hypothetical protein
MLEGELKLPETVLVPYLINQSRTTTTPSRLKTLTPEQKSSEAYYMKTNVSTATYKPQEDSNSGHTQSCTALDNSHPIPSPGHPPDV